MRDRPLAVHPYPPIGNLMGFPNTLNSHVGSIEGMDGGYWGNSELHPWASTIKIGLSACLRLSICAISLLISAVLHPVFAAYRHDYLQRTLPLRASRMDRQAR